MANIITAIINAKAEERKAAAKAVKRANTKRALKRTAVEIASMAISIGVPIAAGYIAEKIENLANAKASEKKETRLEKTPDGVTTVVHETETTNDESAGEIDVYVPVEVNETPNFYKVTKSIVGEAVGNVKFIRYDIEGNLRKMKELIDKVIKESDGIRYDEAVMIGGRLYEAISDIILTSNYEDAAKVAAKYDSLD